MSRLPRIEANGVPFCSRDRCPSYDGKRCREIGFMPDVVCGPEVAAMADELRRLRKRDRAWQRATRCGEPEQVHERTVRLCSCDGAILPQLGDEVDACWECDGLIKVTESDEPVDASAADGAAP